MKVLKTEKLNETLTQTWTKYIDYRLLMDSIINTIKLYASNASIVQSNKKNTASKLVIAKTNINASGIIFDVNFDLNLDNIFATGTLSALIRFDGTCVLSNTKVNFFN
jgi:hypothetical protein